MITGRGPWPGPNRYRCFLQDQASRAYPRQITIVPAVPLTSAGKLDRKKLRTWTG
jgi:non-ribosomal peptide synthetase component E (peptide arylation enzyme)